jgi:hypothetical protein
MAVRPRSTFEPLNAFRDFLPRFLDDFDVFALSADPPRRDAPLFGVGTAPSKHHRSPGDT